MQAVYTQCSCVLTEIVVIQEQVIEPVVKETANVLDTCVECGIKRVVVTSSIGAVYMDPSRDPEAAVDENCLNELDHCIQTKVLHKLS